MPVKKLSSVGIPAFGKAYQRILWWLFAYPDKTISLTDLCAQTSTSKSAGRIAVLRLEKEGFIRKAVIAVVDKVDKALP